MTLVNFGSESIIRSYCGLKLLREVDSKQTRCFIFKFTFILAKYQKKKKKKKKKRLLELLA